jgi:single-strand DNA-binding protein
VNSVHLIARLTADPDAGSTPAGTSVTKLRVAVPERVKNSATGEYEDKAHFVDVTVWGAQAEACGRYLSKGRRVAIEGRLQHSEWQADDGSKRQKLEVVARNVEFLDSAKRDDETTEAPMAVEAAA